MIAIPRPFFLCAVALLAAAAVAQVGPNDLPDSDASGIRDAVVPNPRVLLYEQLQGDTQFGVFTKLLPFAEQDQYLGSPTGRATVFAPTNSAFATMARTLTGNKVPVDDSDPQSIVDVLMIGLADVARVDNGELPNMRQLIKYHILGNAYPMQEIEKKTVWETLAGLKLRVYEGKLVDGDPASNTTVSARNTFCRNGWLHTIHSVLTPYDLALVASKVPLVPSPTPTGTATATPSTGFTPSPSLPASAPSLTASASPVPVAATDSASTSTDPASDPGSDETGSDPGASGSGSSETGDGSENEETGEADASISPGPEDGDGAVCFPASATVHGEHGRIRMDQLSVGDVVRHGTDAGAFSKVFLFTHRAAHVRKVAFVRVATDCGHAVTMTRSHYLRAADGALVAAGAVRTGDRVRTMSGVCAVADIGTVVEDGLFAPHATDRSADLVVDGVVASSYSQAVHPTLAHALLAPLRLAFGHVVDPAKVKMPLERVFRNGADSLARLLPSGNERH